MKSKLKPIKQLVTREQMAAIMAVRPVLRMKIEKRIREALSEPAEATNDKQFDETMVRMKTRKRPKHRPIKLNEETLGQAVYPGKEAWKNEPGNRYTIEELREMERNWKVEVYNPAATQPKHSWPQLSDRLSDQPISRVEALRQMQTTQPLSESAQRELRRSHDWIDRRSLALDLAIVKKLQARPALIERAKKTLNKWIQQRQPAVPPIMLEWHTILDTWPMEKVLELLTRFDENARRLRQSSPFCGILSAEERLEIFREFEQ